MKTSDSSRFLTGLKAIWGWLKCNWLYPSIFLLVIFLLSSILYLNSAPSSYPVSGKLFEIKEGTTLTESATGLYSNGAIRSVFFFKVIYRLFYDHKPVLAGDYVLDEKESAWKLASRLSRGEYHLSLTRVTLTEGLTAEEMGEILAKKFININTLDFLAKAKKSEGFLFPDTYLFYQDLKTESAIGRLLDNFNSKWAKYKEEAIKTGKSQSEIIKLASIVELEANNNESRKIVAGILWRRLALGMPLQVNATFKYIGLDKTFMLTTEDTKIDSPYNTYIHKGLPPTPVCNPGELAIEAVLRPTKTSYLYFITDRAGEMHYAKTYAEHLANKAMYLK